MDWGTVAAAALVPAALWVIADVVRRLPRVWRGESRDLSAIPRLPFAVHPRSYLTFAIWVASFFGASAVLVLGLLVHVEWVLFTGIGLGLASLPAAGLHLVVNALNRPRFLVPPTHRDEPGWVNRPRR